MSITRQVNYLQLLAVAPFLQDQGAKQSFCQVPASVLLSHVKGAHSSRVEVLMGCSRAQWVPSAVNQHRCAPAHSLVPGGLGEGCHGPQAAPWE